MRIRIQIVIDGDESTRRELASFERSTLCAETLGLQLAEAKQMLAATQSIMVESQVAEHLRRTDHCTACGRSYRRKGRHTVVVRSLFGRLELSSPRWRRCACQPDARPGSFSPLAQCLPERTLPERLYLESRWASLMSYGMTTRLLEDTLPLEGMLHVNSVRNHAYRMARRCEQELLLERAENRIEAEAWPHNNIPPPKPRITVALDGGYVRSRDAPSPREGWFEVITGKSTAEQSGSKCFAFVHRVDRHAKQRMGQVFRAQGMVYHQPVTFVSDGGETVRSWPQRLHPGAEHVIDWFHVAMRFTVLQQMAKGVLGSVTDDCKAADNPVKLLDSAKWYLWHGNTYRALQRLEELLEVVEYDERIPATAERRKFARTLTECYHYIDANRSLIPDYGDRRRHGESIASSAAESTVNQVISHRFVKKQQMRWQPENAHWLLQLRTHTLNNDLRSIFERWYPKMAAAPASAPAFA